MKQSAKAVAAQATPIEILAIVLDEAKCLAAPIASRKNITGKGYAKLHSKIFTMLINKLVLSPTSSYSQAVKDEVKKDITWGFAGNLCKQTA